jgi:hypothetical protein
MDYISPINEDHIKDFIYTDIIKKDSHFDMLDKPLLDDCYICLDNISNKQEHSAVFMFSCRHPICKTCFFDIRRNFTLYHIKHKMVCGICRSKTNNYIAQSNSLVKVSYSRMQSIIIPRTFLTEVNVHSDHIQRLIAYSVMK